jgi:hypothetical protein
MIWIDELRERVAELEQALRIETERAELLRGQLAANERHMITIAEAFAGLEGELHPER